jgi:hypothetical protein
VTRQAVGWIGWGVLFAGMGEKGWRADLLSSCCCALLNIVAGKRKVCSIGMRRGKWEVSS